MNRIQSPARWLRVKNQRAGREKRRAMLPPQFLVTLPDAACDERGFTR
jgi:hypothetical protein